MIASALRFARAAPGSTMALVLALAVLINVGFDGDQGDSSAAGDRLPALTPLRHVQRTASPAPAGSALFDPGRRDETLAGSIDDLRPKEEPAAAPSTTVEITGVLIGPTFRKAMFKVAGAAPVWIDADADVGGWHVAAIDGEGAVIERGGDTLTLKIADRYKHRGGRATPDGAPAGANDAGADAGAIPDPSNPGPNPSDAPGSPSP